MYQIKKLERLWQFTATLKPLQPRHRGTEAVSKGAMRVELVVRPGVDSAFPAWRVEDASRRPTITTHTEQDTLAQWLEDCCELGAWLGDTHTSLWGSWSHCARSHGDDPGGSKGFRQALLKRGFRQIKNTNGIRGRGIGASVSGRVSPKRMRHDRGTRDTWAIS